MFNRKSIYALNKKDPNAIVYTDADGNFIRLTCDDFACAAEFRRWKDWSDSDLRKEENADQMPSEAECTEARKNLAKVDWAVDYVITHCAPTSIALMGNRHNEADPLTDFLQEVKERAYYHYWLFGHYQHNRAIDEKHILLWEQIVQVI